MILSAVFVNLNSFDSAASIMIFVFYTLTFCCLTIVVKKIDISVSYAIWSGMGTALVSIVGIFYFNESITILKISCLFLIITGVVGLLLFGESH